MDNLEIIYINFPFRIVGSFLSQVHCTLKHTLRLKTEDVWTYVLSL